jgi:tetratricopeptide (TPR) repeat protein
MPEPLGNSWEMRDINYLAEKELGKSLKPSEISGFWYQKGWHWILNNKTDFLRLFIKKLYFTINNIEISNNRNLSQFFGTFPFLGYNPLNYGIIVTFAILAIILALLHGKNRKEIIHLFIFVASYFIVISMFFINARFRLPVIPLLIIMTSYTVLETSALIKTRKILQTALILFIPGIVVLFFSYSNIYGVQTNNIDSGNYNLGNYNLFKGDFDTAAEYFRKVLNSDEGFLNGNLNMGAAFLKGGNIDSAEYYFNRELDYHPQNARAWSNLASINYIKNDFQKALELSEQAILLKPYLVDPHLIKIRTALALDDSRLLEDAIETGIQKASYKARINYEAGLVYSQVGKYNKAINYLKKSFLDVDLPIESDDRAMTYFEQISIKSLAAYQLGYLYGITGDLENSIHMSKTAIQLDSNIAEAYINLANAFLSHSDMKSASNLLKIADDKFPDNELITRMQKLIK